MPMQFRPAAQAAILALAACAALPANAQHDRARECAEREARMKQYLDEARNLRETERGLAQASRLQGGRLAHEVNQVRSTVNFVRQMGGDTAMLRSHLDYLEELQLNERTGGFARGREEHPFLAGVRARRERVATNISHSRQAMESLRCGQQRAAPPAQAPQDFGALGPHFCCRWFIPNLNTYTCGPMQQTARCTAQPQGQVFMNHYCHIQKGCTPNGQ